MKNKTKNLETITKSKRFQSAIGEKTEHSRQIGKLHGHRVTNNN
jgi:hypothetical protein